MTGNSSRRGAIRNPGSKKGPTAGSGGQRRRALQGKGPTPKATERTAHPAARKAASTGRRADSGQASRSGSRRSTGTVEVVSGRNPVVEALRAAVPAKALFVAARVEMDDRVREAMQLAADRGLPLLETPRGDLDRLSGGSLHQGLVLQVPPYRYASVDDLIGAARDSGRAPLLVMLDGVTDPRNLGAVVRSVGAFGGHGVLIPERRAAGMTASAWKTSAGAAARVPVARVTNLTRTLEDLKAAGCFAIGLDSGGDALLAELPTATEPLVLVIGSEGKGLSRLVRQTCDQIAAIPMAGAVESLNASVAAGIALYQISVTRARG